MLKKPDGSKWNPTKLDYFIHEKMRLEKALEDMRIKFLRGGDSIPKVKNYLVRKYEKKIEELRKKIELEEMKRP